MPLEAVISIGCIIFSVFADTFLKPLKWAAGTAIDIAKKILDKISSFPKKAISFVKSLPGRVKQIPLVRKGYDTVNNLCMKLSNYIDDLFSKALATSNGAPTNVGKDFVQEIVEEETENVVRHEITNKLKNHVLNNHFLDKVLQQVKRAPIENVKNIAENKSFFNPKWSQQKVLEATKYAYNIALVSGKRGTFFLEYAGEKIGVYVSSNGTVDTVYGMYKYTFEELMKLAGR